MSYDQRLAVAGAQMIARNEGRRVYTDTDLAHAQWVIAGIRRQATFDHAADAELKQRIVGPELRDAPKLNDGGGNVQEHGPTALGGPPKALRAASKAQGFTGDCCDQCSNFTIKRTGTCTTCVTCGANSGCS